jgi:ABC-type glycerol-3-phosphate transport system permease component
MTASTVAPVSKRAGHRSRLRPRQVAYAACLVVALLVILFPVYWIVLSAFTPQPVLFGPDFDFLPFHLTLANFQQDFDVVPVFSEFWHSILLAVVPATLAVAVALPAAYAFARMRFVGRSALLAVVVFTGFMPIVCSIIPLYELFKAAHLVGSWWSLLIVYTAFQLGFSTWILVVFISRIPQELEDAARLDGASQLGVLRWVIAPLLRPAVASLFIVNFLASWNQFLLPAVFSTDTSTTPLVMGIAQAGINPQYQTVVWGAEASFGLFVAIPPILIVLLFQRRIASGLTAGAVKG